MGTLLAKLKEKGKRGGKNEEEGGEKKESFAADFQAIKGVNVDEEVAKQAYDVTNFYWTEGIFQKVARSGPFNNITLGVISFNALWMGIDSDLNDAETLATADTTFQVAEHLFAVYFTGELIIRFGAFKNKCDTMRDGWFKFDSFLCILMILETWIVPNLASDGGGLPIDTSMLRLLRLLRLSRMMRLLRKCPELLTLLKGMFAAVRSVGSTLVLLVIFMYIFAIIFRQQAKGNEALEGYFGSMGLCFWTLLLHGTMLDNVTDALTEIKDGAPALAAVFLVFVLLGNFTVLNMLIGVLCEVVSAVQNSEVEKSQVEYAKESFLQVLSELDADGSGTITHAEFDKFVLDPRVKDAFDELDVDREGLLDLADVIFEEEDETGCKANLDFAGVLQIVLKLRNSNAAVVKDIVELRKFIGVSQERMNLARQAKIQKLSEHVATLQEQISFLYHAAATSNSSTIRNGPRKDFSLSDIRFEDDWWNAGSRNFDNYTTVEVNAARELNAAPRLEGENDVCDVICGVSTARQPNPGKRNWQDSSFHFPRVHLSEGESSSHVTPGRHLA